ncbi:MAG TPA: Dna2/Cas4 domain-containing protein [Candidatus Marinimicrobia bacterium]|nr:Dna2/Cas4 domain-containing protein [Candidatus Neomarinimicrobiota bacterium]
MQLLSGLTDISTLDQNCLVQASAGTGKTWHLSKRYCAILDDFLKEQKWPRCKHGNILVLTFTRKAAAEMKSRIFQELQQILIEKKSDLLIDMPEYASYLRQADEATAQELLLSFGQNRITTIDSFSSTLLREYSEEAELDPRFEVLDESAANHLFQDCFQQMILAGTQKSDPDLYTLLAVYSVHGIAEMLKFLENHYALLGPLAEHLETHSEDELWRKWLENYLPMFDAQLWNEKWSEVFQNFEYYFPNLTEKQAMTLENVRRKFLKLSRTDDHVQARLQFLNWIAENLLKKTNDGYNSILFGKGKKLNPQLGELYQKMQNELPIEKILSVPNEEDKKTLPRLKALLRLFHRFREAKLAKMNELNQYTFNIIIEKAAALLTGNPKLAADAGKQFEHILIDEFQDTNTLRWELISALFRKGKEEWPTKGLYIVGDSKQSIYSFQQADVRVLNGLRKQLDKNIINFPLLGSFRVSSQLNEQLFKPLFEKLLSKEEAQADYDVVYEHAEVHKKNQRKDFKYKECDSVAHFDFWGCSESLKKSFYTPAIHCAEAIREAQQWLEKNRSAIEATHSDSPDIGVLLRSFTEISSYQQAFNEAGFDYQIIGGRGLYSRQETFDIYHLLKVLADPEGNELPLLGLLRSPLFLLSDLEIEILREKKEISLYQALGESEFGKDYYLGLEKLRKRAAKDPIMTWLPELLASGHRILGYVSETDNRQRLANWHKVADELQLLQNKGLGLSGLIQYLEQQFAEPENKSPQADLPGTAKIQVMTIHKAKGLQFKTVVLPNLTLKPKPKSDPIAIAELKNQQGQKQNELFIKAEDNNGAILKKLKEKLNREEEAEDKRLFYVAVTRAEFKIWFLGDAALNPKSEETESENNKAPAKYKTIDRKSIWVSKIMKGLMSDENKLEKVNSLSAFSEKISRMPGLSFREKEFYEAAKLQQILKAEKISDIPETEISAAELPLPKIPEIPKLPEMLHLNPHELMELLSDKISYETANFVTERESKARVLGTLFHLMREKQWRFPQNENELKNWIGKNYREFHSSELLPELQALDEAYWKHPFAKHIENAAENYTELPVSGELRSDSHRLIVSGIIDLLMKDKNDQWIIIDYKTDRNLNSLSAYKVQMESYIWLVKQNYGLDARGILYFSALGEIQEVFLSEAYFQELSRAIGSKNLLTPKFPEAIADISPLKALLEKHDGQPLLIIYPTRYQAQAFQRSLAQAALLRPAQRHSALSSELQRFSSEKHKISKQLLRFLIQSYLETQGSTPKTGVIDEVASAWLYYDKNRSFAPSEKWQKLFEFIQEKKEQYQLISDGDLLRDENFLKEYEKQTLILYGDVATDEEEKIFYQKLAQRCAAFYLIDTVNTGSQPLKAPKADKLPQLLSQKQNQPLQVFSSIWEECSNTAGEIYRLLTNENSLSPDQIKIAVSLPSRYLPVLEQILPLYGLTPNESSGLPWNASPAGQFWLAWLRLLLPGAAPDWNDLLYIGQSRGLGLEVSIQKLERYRRSQGLRFWTELARRFEKEKLDESAALYQADWKRLNTWLQAHRQIWQNAKGNAWKLAENLKANIIALQPKLSGNEIKLSAKISETLENTLHNASIARLSISAAALISESVSALNHQNIRGSRRQGGIEIIGFMDSLQIQPKKLFVLGLTDDQFPAPVPAYRALQKALPPSWPIAWTQLQHWFLLGENCIFSAPLADAQDQTLNITIMDFLFQKQKIISSKNPFNKENHYLAVADKRLANPHNSRHITRHNDFLSPQKGHFEGLTSPKPEMIYGWAGKLNDLLLCPMRFHFSHNLKIKDSDGSPELMEASFWGNLLHQTVANYFRENPQPAEHDYLENCQRMAQSLENELKKSEGYPWENQIIRQIKAKYWMQGLADGNEKNLLCRLIRWHLPQDTKRTIDISPMCFLYDELVFKNLKLPAEEPLLQLEGRIDLLFFNKENRSMLLSDLKTGSIDVKKALNNYDGQLALYLLALLKGADFFRKNEEGREENIELPQAEYLIAAYEQIKNEQYCKLIPVWNSSANTDDKKTGVYFDAESIIEHWLDLVKEIQRGETFITKKEMKIACEYCPYTKVCRKSVQSCNLIGDEEDESQYNHSESDDE